MVGEAINVVIVNPWFPGVFFGSGVACIIVVVAALLRLGLRAAASSSQMVCCT